MSGVTLMFSAIVLINNSLNALHKIEDNSNALLNIFTGLLYIILNIAFIIHGIWTEQSETYYYSTVGGLLFGFTYFTYGINRIFKFDQRNLGWYSLYVAINSVIFAALCFRQIGGGPLDGISWLVWGFLWLTNFLVHNLGIKIGDWLSYFTIVAAIFTCWIPGLLMLLGLWP